MDAYRLAERLGPERKDYGLEAAAIAIETYRSGRSSRIAQRESGVPERTIDRWVEVLGIKRSKQDTARIKQAALDAGRVTSLEIRRRLGAL